ncbi:hypothetical protein TTHERM_00083560 (macronuclear) [Tetrahymena thermophila SB210]|uniref:Uncharacterized protein n=1 Tax=Tetrahymena thermophila (strain SB210) TaxID=312017 RepID=Q236Z3_TETTS|nr:hypothetical protein TTHERM_00083560 [Tetrahymena thermophila SB210]EAR92357.1 hypothetical protein TTHERM_00083560 [Tetrahymena thermophila SB210]|eukprot:XP_001012602.1 hypothetical protein TTHERM_00083560 [Tetrahymena thermophila SB210]
MQITYVIQKKQISKQKEQSINHCTSSIEQIVSQAQIKENEFQAKKPTSNKLNSSIFQKDFQTFTESSNQLLNDYEKLNLKNISKQQIKFNRIQQKNSIQRNHDSISIKTYSPQKENILNKSIQNEKRHNLSEIITRYRSSTTQEDSRKKNSEFFSTPQKKILQFKSPENNLKHSFSTSSFITQPPKEENHQIKKILHRSQTYQNLNSTQLQDKQPTVGIKKEQQCLLIKSAFTLLPNNRYLPLDDDKIITIRTPVSSSDSSDSGDINEDLTQSHKKVEPINESSKQFLKNFLKERRQQEKQNTCIKMSNQVRKIQQTILNKVLNEMNKEKERKLIIKNLEIVKFLMKNKKKLTSEDYDPLVHYRPKDNFCKNKKTILKLNSGFHPPKDSAAIARDQQEEQKNFIIPCQKQNFFGSEYRRMLNRGVPQIVKDLQSFRQ